MATVTISHSQRLVDALFSRDSNVVTNEMTDFAKLAGFFSLTTQAGVMLSLNGPTVEIQDGSLHYVARGALADVEYTGLAPSAFGSTASAIRFSMNNELVLEQQGQFNLHYVEGGFGVRLQQVEGVASSGTLQMTLKHGNNGYDDVFGNVRVSFAGALRTSADGSTSGSIKRLTVSAEQLLKQTVVEGDFTVVDDSSSYGSVNGTLARYESSYLDGSIESFSGTINISTNPNLKLVENGANFAGDDVFDVRMPARLNESMTLQAGAGNDIVTLLGGGGQLNLAAGSGNDVIKVLGDSHGIAGGEGVDTVILWGKRDEFTKTDNGATQTYTHRDGGVVTLTGVEIVEFSGIRISHDISGNAGQAYRIYKAAFDRAPDAVGLGFWIYSLNSGYTPAQAASDFLSSTEYVTRYGASISDNGFIHNLYHNVLHREADDGGANYWAARLSEGSSRGQVLAEFSESSENQAQVIGAIQNGIDYLPF